MPEKSAFRTTVAMVALGVPLLVPVAIAASSAPAQAETFGGGNGLIAFAKAPDLFTSDFDIYTIAADGTGLTQLTSGPAFDTGPDFSPDGTRIVFERRIGFDSDLWVMNADGTGQVQVTSGPHADNSPSWSADGTRIAYHSDRDDPHGDIFVVNADGTGVTNLTNTVGTPEIQANFSPDGTRIAYLAPVPTTNRYDVHVMNADGTGQTNVTSTAPGDGYSHSDPSWSPDGSRIIFVTSRAGDASGSHVYTIAPDGTALTRLTNDPVIDAVPSYSPDASTILFQRSVGDFDLYTMNPDGSGIAPIVDNTPDHDVTPAWQPVPSADLSLTKSTPQTSVLAGDPVTYTLSVTNDGPSASPGTVITDPVPAGVTVTGLGPGCAVVGPDVECTIGFLAAGATASRQVTFTVDSGYTGAAVSGSDHDHQFTVNKVETHVTMAPGQTRTGVVQCAIDEVLTDGSWRIDAVDTGQPEDLVLLEAQSNGPQDFVVTFTNPTAGNVQFKVFGVCLKKTTSTNAGHAHTVATVGPMTTSPGPVAAGTRVLTASCAEGQIAVAPGHRVFSAEADLIASVPINDGNAWQFTFSVSVGGTLQVSVWCLPLRTSTVSGHSHQLVSGLRDRTVSVPGLATVNETVSCPDDAKGIVALYETSGPLFFVGSDPQPKSRVFRVRNRGGGPASARIGLVCLADRTGRGSDTELVNSACVDGAYVDPVPADDCDEATVNVVPAPHGLVTIGPTVTVLNPGASGHPRQRGSTRLSVPVTCREAGGCRGAVRVLARVDGDDRVIAIGDLVQGLGDHDDVVVGLTRAGRRHLAGWVEDRRVTVTVALRLPEGRTTVSRRPRLVS